MTTTDQVLAYAAKAALFGRLEEVLPNVTVDPEFGSGAQVSYTFPSEPERVLVYGAGVRWNQQDAVAEPGVAIWERGTIDVLIRVHAAGGDPDSAQAADAIVADLVAEIGRTLRADPYLFGQLAVTGMSTGDSADPIFFAAPEEAIIATTALTVTYEGTLLGDDDDG